MTEAKIKKELAKILKVVDKAVDKVKENKNDFDEAINWGDFCCRRVYYTINMEDEGDSHYTVHLEEADPSCSKVKAYIEDYLIERGYGDNIYIECEW